MKITIEIIRVYRKRKIVRRINNDNDVTFRIFKLIKKS